MKNLKILLAVFSITFGMLIMNACSDDCKDVVCVHGYCEDGVCICNEGYEGSDCGTEMRAKFLGSFTFTDSCWPGVETNSTISTSGEGVTKVLISNILGEGLQGTAKATIAGSNITIPNQTVMDVDQDPWTVEGTTTGTFSNNAFSLNVRFIFGTYSEVCTLSFSKK